MPDENLVKLGERAKQIREEHKMSQQDVSDISGLAIRTVSRIERGLMNPSYEVLSSLASALGTSIKGLLTYPHEEANADVQELVELYQSCQKQEQRLILAVVRAVKNESMDSYK